jgi:hypothetical protein
MCACVCVRETEEAAMQELLCAGMGQESGRGWGLLTVAGASGSVHDACPLLRQARGSLSHRGGKSSSQTHMARSCRQIGSRASIVVPAVQVGLGGG